MQNPETDLHENADAHHRGGDPHTAVAAARARADADPMRPRYHFHAPSNWMNDPNGTVYHDGWCEVFYQHNPYGDKWDRMHWGHARTRDLIHWEHLPIALAPDAPSGETGCWSGVCISRGGSAPIILYTSARDRDTGESFAQKIADGDASFIAWRQRERPFLTIADVPFPIHGDWRDPFVFRDASHTFMAVAARPLDDTRPPAILVFRASDDSLESWKFHGVLFDWTETDSLPECPNFIRVGDEWVLLVSPFAPVRFFRGAFDPVSGRFTARETGFFDRSPQYYATNTIVDDAGRTIVLAWLRGFPEGRGWNGCLALPRQISVAEDGAIERTPVSEIQRLRGARRVVDPAAVAGADPVPITDVEPASIELIIRFAAPAGSAVRVEFFAGERQVIAVECTASELTVDGVAAPVEPPPGRAHEIRLFTDRSVIELYLDRGRDCVTRVVPDLHLCDRATVTGIGGAEIKHVEYYAMSDATYDFSQFPAY